jgi:hypothetical protein
LPRSINLIDVIMASTGAHRDTIWLSIVSWLIVPDRPYWVADLGAFSWRAAHPIMVYTIPLTDVSMSISFPDRIMSLKSLDRPHDTV